MAFYEETTIPHWADGINVGTFVTVLVQPAVTTCKEVYERAVRVAVERHGVTAGVAVMQYFQTEIGWFARSQERNGWRVKDLGLRNSYFDQGGFGLLDFEYAGSGQQSEAKLGRSFGQALQELAGGVD